MENAFFLILIGFLIYGAKRATEKQSKWTVLAFFICIGAGMTAALNKLAPIEAPGNSAIPIWFTACMGALTGLLLWAADQQNFFNAKTVKFSALAVLTGIHATISYFTYTWFAAEEHLLIRMSVMPQAKFAVFIHFVLLAALSFFGFTIMERAMQRANPVLPESGE